MITEKKWFVFVGDRHIGPHSVEEVAEKLSLGQLSVENFVWTEGMADWQLMREVRDFDSITGIMSPPAGATAAGHPSMSPGADLEVSAPMSQLSSEIQASGAVRETSNEANLHNEPTLLNSAAPRATAEVDPVISAVRRYKGTNVSSVASGDASAETLSDAQKNWVHKFADAAKIGLIMLLLSGAALSFAYYKGLLDPILRLPSVQKRTDKAMDSLQQPFLALGERIPIFQKWFSPLPKLPDLDSKEADDLKIAAQGRPESVGAHFGIALSKQDLLSPSFYISSNLPDDTQLRLYVVGIPDTLLEHLSFQAQYPITIKKKFGQTPVIRDTGGEPIPRGEYAIYLTPAETQSQPQIQSLIASLPSLIVAMPEPLPKDLKVLASKSYFLGGRKDEAYMSRLKLYHEQLRTRAAAEIIELKQFVVTLENQLNSTTTKFALLRKGKVGPAQKKVWDGFHREWVEFESQLDQIFQRWTPEVLQKEIFYGNLYQMTQQAGEAIQKVHGLHLAYFNGKKDPNSFDIQLGEAASSASNAISQLKGKIEQMEKLPPSANGMPRREN